jgi:hypothetical protein
MVIELKAIIPALNSGGNHPTAANGIMMAL